MMRDHVDLDQVGTIVPDNFRRYLLASGWRQRRLKAGHSPSTLHADLFTKTGHNGLALQLPLPTITESLDFKERLRDALQTLVDSERRPVASLVEAIQQVGYDVLRSAVPTALVKDDSIRLSSAKAYVAGMRELLASSATTEINRLPFFSRQLKEGLLFADSCRFGHTYKGSFGFVLESPLPSMTTEPLFPEAPPIPFERRVMQRIAHGFQLVDQAVSADNIASLVDGYKDGLNANGCEDLADLVAGVSPAGLVFALRLSPEWRSYIEGDEARFEVGPAHVEVCRAAAKELRRNDVAVPARVAGLVVRLQNETDPTDLNERTGAHEVFLLWASVDFGDVRVKVNLTPPEYLDAVRAHAAGRPVRVSGTLSKYGRQWVLQQPHDFRVSEQTELPL